MNRRHFLSSLSAAAVAPLASPQEVHAPAASSRSQVSPGGTGADEVWLGVNPGWEAYGGIIRPTYVELRPAAFVDNVRFGYKLNAASSAASCQMTVFLSSDAPRQGALKVVLGRGKTEIARSSKAV